MGNCLAWVAVVGGGAVAVAAFILNVLYIKLARKQLASSELESQRLQVEIDKLIAERDYLRQKAAGSSLVT
ncbi:MAG: hypothetical protein V3T01_03050 [Myxococcota bacterium]